MKHINIFILVACLAILYSCGGSHKGAPAQESHDTHDHSAGDAHNHDADDHKGHDHSAGDAHNHDADDHKGHDHSAGDAHNHDGDDHKGHDHSAGDAHNHDADDHKGHDHSAGDAHNHDGDDHKGHDHSAGETCGAGAVSGIQYDHSDEIVFPAAQAAKTDFEVQTAVRGSFNNVIKASGQVMPAQGDQYSVVAPVSGIVSFAGMQLSQGNTVRHSQTLFYISSQNVVSGDIVAKATAKLRKVTIDFERAKELITDRIVSQQEYDAARLAYEEATIEYNALGGAASSSARGVAVNSPSAGYVTSLEVNAGDYVEVGQLLGSVSQNKSLTLRTEVSMRYAAALQTITTANFTVPYNNTTYKLSDMRGRLLSASRNLSAGSTLMPITFQFDNTGVVVPGSYVEVSLLGVTETSVITLPLTAITEQQGLYYIYVQIDPEGYLRREVKIGADDGMRVKILSGLEPNERVVTRGAINVKMASASDAIPHGHEH